MPTNDERREVAARLRNYENLRESFRESPICAFLDALGVGYLDWKGVCNCLADLIEPEPERTCMLTHVRWDDGMCTWGVKCSECGARFEHETGECWRYCPSCGAEVVS